MIPRAEVSDAAKLRTVTDENAKLKLCWPIQCCATSCCKTCWERTDVTEHAKGCSTVDCH